MRLLLIEDNTTIAENIREFLHLQTDWQVDVAMTKKEGLLLFEKHHYDLVLLDIMLPDGTGYEVAKILKEEREIPLIFLTAKNMLEDKLQGFDLGADDYITKPFAMEELIARIEVLIKRYQLDTIHIGNMVIDIEWRKLRKGSEELHLSNTEFLLVSLLLRNRGYVVSRVDILEELWGSDAVWDKKIDRKLDVYIAGIRKKCGKAFILTHKGVGYSVKKW